MAYSLFLIKNFVIKYLKLSQKRIEKPRVAKTVVRSPRTQVYILKIFYLLLWVHGLVTLLFDIYWSGSTLDAVDVKKWDKGFSFKNSIQVEKTDLKTSNYNAVW